MSFLLGTLLYSIQESVIKLFFQFRDIFYKLTVFFLTSTVIVWLAVFLYASFYYTYMPSVSHVKPVHFNFKSCPYRNGPCSYPSANVTLLRKGYDQLLMRGQQYKVYLDLEMPESSVNQEMGMFMIKIDFLSQKGEVVQSSARTAILHYKSALLSLIHTLVYSPFLLTGSLEEKQTVSVELFDYYEEDPRSPSNSALLEIQSYSVQFYKATLRIFAHFTGLRYLMFHWPLISAIVGVGTNLFFITIIVLLSWYRYITRQESTHVVVRVGLDEPSQRIEARRQQVKQVLIRERKRISSAKDEDNRSRSRSQSPAPFRMGQRTHSLETFQKLRFQDEPQRSKVAESLGAPEHGIVKLTSGDRSLLETDPATTETDSQISETDSVDVVEPSTSGIRQRKETTN